VRTGRRVSVIGSGPAGLAAADQLNKMGHEVSSHTARQTEQLSGSLLLTWAEQSCSYLCVVWCLTLSRRSATSTIWSPRLLLPIKAFGNHSLCLLRV
jgi:hypothetical protein